jgi:uncharacterized protein YoxC
MYMANTLKKILGKLDEISNRLDKLEKDMEFIKVEARANNVSIKEIEKMVEDMDDRLLTLYDDVGSIDEQLSGVDTKLDLLGAMMFPEE